MCYARSSISAVVWPVVIYTAVGSTVAGAFVIVEQYEVVLEFGTQVRV